MSLGEFEERRRNGIGFGTDPRHSVGASDVSAGAHSGSGSAAIGKDWLSERLWFRTHPSRLVREWPCLRPRFNQRLLPLRKRLAVAGRTEHLQWRRLGCRGWAYSLVLLAVASGVDAQVAIRDAAATAPPNISVGGQVREQYERFQHEEWGGETPDDNGYWLQRYMFHVDAQVWRGLRAYVELKSGIEVGRAGGPRPPDEDQLDLHQAFLDLSFGPATVRLGRQELAFGTQRLISVREGPNMRQTFDGGNLVIQHGRWRVDGFGARYVETDTGMFDDSPTTGRTLWGVYAVRGPDSGGTAGIDLYYLGYRRDEASFDQGTDREVRHSWGVRAWGRSTTVDYNTEAVLQAGTFGQSRIRAWTVASDTGYRPVASVRLGVRADVTSGDADRHDDRLGTFNPLFPKGDYFGLVSSLAPSNHIDVHPQVTIDPRPDLVIRTSWLFFWRQQIDDGIYGIPGNLIRSGEGTQERFVGQSPGLEVEWQATKQLSLTGDLSLFTAGPFIRESGPPAEDTAYVAGWITYRF